MSFRIEIDCLDKLDEDSEYFIMLTQVEPFSEVVMYISTGHTETIQGIDFKSLPAWSLAEFIVDAVNEKTEREK